MLEIRGLELCFELGWKKCLSGKTPSGEPWHLKQGQRHNFWKIVTLFKDFLNENSILSNHLSDCFCDIPTSAETISLKIGITVSSNIDKNKLIAWKSRLYRREQKKIENPTHLCLVTCSIFIQNLTRYS